MLERDLLLNIRASLKSWEEVADELERRGKLKRSKAVWWKIGNGGPLLLVHRNAIRRYLGRQLLELDAATFAEKHGITRTIQAGENPDVAIFAQLDGLNIAKITLRTSDAETQQTVSVSVTTVTTRLTPMERVWGYSGFFDAVESEPRQNKSPVSVAINEVLRNAADALAATVSDEDEARWIKQLGG
ncbi:MAG: hypothetical protein GY832_44575 [Chloroflexi bacterium]|nr:hypothetical protein [Chloroflexota bacterium]